MRHPTNKLLVTAISAACIGLFTATSSATTIGIDTDPAGSGWNRGDPNTGYAVWDTFASYTFGNVSPDAGSAGLTSPALSQSETAASQGTGVYNNNDAIYPGNETLNFTAAATTAFDVHSVYLQLKSAGATSSPSGTFSDSVSPTINGLSPASVSSVTGTESAGAYSVTTWYWPLAGDVQSLNLAFNLTPHIGELDTVALDAGAPTPEPASAGLGCLCMGGVLLRRRRKTGGTAV